MGDSLRNVANSDICFDTTIHDGCRLLFEGNTQLVVEVIMDFTNLVIRKILKWAMKPGCKAGKLYLWRNLLQWFDFGVGEKIANARTCADSNGHNFWKIENVQGFLHVFAYKGLDLTV